MVEQLEEQQIDLRIVRWVAGEGEPALEQRTWVDQLRRERGDGFYSDLIFACWVNAIHRQTPMPCGKKSFHTATR